MKPVRKNRSRSYYRHHRRRVIERKVKLVKSVLSFEPSYESVIKYGKFAKGKIHCSCWMCSQKTKKDGFPHSQVKQLESLDSQLNDYQTAYQ